MRILIDIGHPAHVLFFKNSIHLLKQQGHQVLVTSREKDITNVLLGKLGIEYISLSTQGDGSVISLAKELIVRNFKLYQQVKIFKPDVMAAIGGIFISHVGKLTGIPALVFYDTENATLQNALTYPFASCVIVPRCYQGWLPKKRSLSYAGYHELSYLSPEYFTPDKGKAIKNGLSETRNTFFIRIVSWQANHDIGEHGWDYELLDWVIEKLSPEGKIIISSEKVLPQQYSEYFYTGDLADVHHLMAYCRAFIGESATMASESAILGVPAIYAAITGRGYTDEQEARYGLVRNVRILNKTNIDEAIIWALNLKKQDVKLNKERLLSDTIDVVQFVVEKIKTYAKQS